MPRRYADYLATDGFTTLNTVSTIGSSSSPALYRPPARCGRRSRSVGGSEGIHAQLTAAAPTVIFRAGFRGRPAVL
jgi:hypothetical protein